MADDQNSPTLMGEEPPATNDQDEAAATVAAAADEEVINETSTHTFTGNPFVYLDDGDDDERPLSLRRVWREEEWEKRVEEREGRDEEREKRAIAERSPSSPAANLSNDFSTALLPAGTPAVTGQLQQGETSFTAASDVMAANLAKMVSSPNIGLEKEGSTLVESTLQLMELYKALSMTQSGASISSTTQDTSPIQQKQHDLRLDNLAKLDNFTGDVSAGPYIDVVEVFLAV